MSIWHQLPPKKAGYAQLMTLVAPVASSYAAEPEADLVVVTQNWLKREIFRAKKKESCGNNRSLGNRKLMANRPDDVFRWQVLLQARAMCRGQLSRILFWSFYGILGKLSYQENGGKRGTCDSWHLMTCGITAILHDRAPWDDIPRTAIACLQRSWTLTWEAVQTRREILSPNR